MKEGASGCMAPPLNTDSTSVRGSDGKIGQLPEQQFDAVEATKVLFSYELVEKERRENNCRCASFHLLLQTS